MADCPVHASCFDGLPGAKGHYYAERFVFEKGDTIPITAAAKLVMPDPAVELTAEG